jgi:hypothetical protein
VNIDGINFEGQFWINVGDKPQVKNGQQWKLRLYDLSGKPATLPGPRNVELIGVHYAIQQAGQTCAEFHVLSPITTPYTMDLYGGAVPAVQRHLPTSCTDPVSRHDQPYSKVLNRFVEGQSPGCAFASPIVWTNTLGALSPDIKVKMRIRENNSQTASQWQTATFTGYRNGQLAPSSYYTALGMKDGKSSLFLAAPAALSCNGKALATWQFPLSSGGSYLLDVDASAFGGTLAFKYAMPNTLSPSFLNERPLPAPDPVVISDETLLILLGVGVAAFVLYRLL